MSIMTRYRLLFVINRYFPYGGLQRDFLRMTDKCAQWGHDVHALTGDWSGSRPQHLDVHIVNTNAMSNHRSNDRLAVELLNEVDEAEYDCIVGFNKIPGLNVYYAGDPCLASRLRTESPALIRALPRYRALLRQEASVFSPDVNTRVMLIAHAEQEHFVAHYGTPKHRFELLPPGIDKQRLLGASISPSERVNFRRTIGISDDEVCLLFVGSNFYLKGVDRAIIALAHLPSELRARTRLVVVGRNDPKRFLKLARSWRVSDRVIFTGPRSDVAAFYHSASWNGHGLLIHPARRENTGTTILEAMVCGLPVLTTAACGYAGRVEQAEAGLVVPEPFDQSALDDGLAHMFGSSLRASWGANAEQYCRRTDLYSMIDRACHVIVEAAKTHRERHDISA